MSFLAGVVSATRKIEQEGNQPKGDDDELSVLRPIFDVVGDDRNIPEVQGGVDLVHEVKRGWLATCVKHRCSSKMKMTNLVDVECEDKGKRTESLNGQRA